MAGRGDWNGVSLWNGTWGSGPNGAYPNCSDGSDRSGWNVFGDPQYNKCQFFGGTPALPEGLGWFILVGMGAILALVTAGLVWIDTKYGGNSGSSEHYATAGRSIKAGLTACDIVAKWTWAATLLQSSNVAYSFGVTGPFWYAAGATVQVLLFAILAVEIKRKCPTIHTFLEIIRYRWGTTAHIVFIVYGFLTNIIVTAMLILGGANVMAALSGVNVYAAAFLIPASCILYTALGGLKGTIIAEWFNVAVIYIALLIYMFMVYGTFSPLGSPAAVWERLSKIELFYPVADNMGGSYMTFFSKSGIIFGIINIIGNFGTVFVDQAYWAGAIAAKPSATYKGYFLGGMAWFAIPFTMATTMGLAARALDLPITKDEAGNGLVPPAVAVALMGKGGAFLMVLQLYMAVVGTACVEQIAVANIVAYDIYRPYINKNATGAQLIMVQRVMVFVYAIISGVLATILLNLKVQLGWVYLFMGIIIGSAVFPVASALTWRKCSAVAAITSTVVTTPLAIMTWLITAHKLYGVVDLKSTGSDYPMLAGNLVSLFFAIIICVIMSYIWPQDFDWNEFKNIPMVEADPNADPNHFDGEDSPEALDKVIKNTWVFGSVLTFVLLVAWPVLALPAKVFSKTYFTFHVVIAIIWGIVAALVCILLPIWEARDAWVNFFTGTTFAEAASKAEDKSTAKDVTAATQA